MRKVRKRNIAIAVLVGAALCVGAALFSARNVTPVIKLIAASKVESQTYRAINNAVATVVNGNVAYSDLVNVVRDENGDIALLQANSIRINNIARSAATMSQQNIERIGEQGIEIPIGTLSGIPLLSGRGFPVRLRIIPVGSVECLFRSEFSSAGVNQTRHKLYITVTAAVSVIVPGATSTVTTRTELLVTECILVGRVPDTYLNTNQLSEAMDLIPDRG